MYASQFLGDDAYCSAADQLIAEYQAAGSQIAQQFVVVKIFDYFKRCGLNDGELQTVVDAFVARLNG